MRFLISVSIAACLLGSVGWCQYLLTRRVDFDITRQAEAHTAVHADDDVSHLYRIEVVLSFDAAQDPFAVRLDTSSRPVRLLVKSGETELIARTDDIDRGEWVEARGLHFRGSHVDLVVRSSPSAAESDKPCALRLRLYRDDETLCDDVTVWSDGKGGHVSGVVRCRLSPRLESVDRGLGGTAE